MPSRTYKDDLCPRHVIVLVRNRCYHAGIIERVAADAKTARRAIVLTVIRDLFCHRFLSASNLLASMAKSSSGEGLDKVPSFPAFPSSSSVGGISGSLGVPLPLVSFSLIGW
jgi:hypothetical protein